MVTTDSISKRREAQLAHFRGRREVAKKRFGFFHLMNDVHPLLVSHRGTLQVPTRDGRALQVFHRVSDSARRADRLSQAPGKFGHCRKPAQSCDDRAQSFLYVLPVIPVPGVYETRCSSSPSPKWRPRRVGRNGEIVNSVGAKPTTCKEKNPPSLFELWRAGRPWGSIVMLVLVRAVRGSS